MTGADATDVLIYGDSIRVPEMRHVVPVAIVDPFLYGEREGTRHVMVHAFEHVLLGDIPGLALHHPEEYGYDQLLAEGLRGEDLIFELVGRAVDDWGISSAVVPASFPLIAAEALRARGLEIVVNQSWFRSQRRSKSADQLDGIRRAQVAADAALAAVISTLQQAQISNDRVFVDNQPLSPAGLKLVIRQVLAEHDCTTDGFVVASGPDAAILHHVGGGEIRASEPILVDVWPKDMASGYYADVTRTFVVGKPSAEISAWHDLCLQALDQAKALIRPGTETWSVDASACDLFESHGFPTHRSKEEGVPLHSGFVHPLGHGLGLDIHEMPRLNARVRGDTLAPGDVVTVEPGLYRPGFGGCRVEDLVVVTDEGYDLLTNVPYDLRVA